MEQILVDAIMDIIVMVIYIGVIFVIGKLTKLTEEKLSAEQNEMLDQFVAKMVAAADQMFKEDDPDGTARMAYVEEMLIKAGYQITDIIKATIESKVHDLNLMQKAVK